MCHRRASDTCCENHGENGTHSLSNHQFGIANLLNNVRPLMITSADFDGKVIKKSNVSGTNPTAKSLKESGNKHIILLKDNLIGRQ